MKMLGFGWMKDRKAEYATHCFLDKGVQRFGNSTSNMAEQFNSVLSKTGIKDLPVISMIKSLIEYIAQKVNARNLSCEQMIRDGITVTPEATKIAIKRGGGTLHVNLIRLTDTNIVAQVSIPDAKPARCFGVVLKQNPADHPDDVQCTASCECKKYFEWGIPCKHVLQVFSEVSSVISPTARAWDHGNRKWYQIVWWVEMYKKQYANYQPPIVTPVEIPRQKLYPLPIPKKKGRKGKKKKVNTVSIEKQKKCWGCGQKGHNYKTCPIPNVYLIVDHLDKSKYGNSHLLDDLKSDL